MAAQVIDVGGFPVTVSLAPLPDVEARAWEQLPAVQPGLRADVGFAQSDGIVYPHLPLDVDAVPAHTHSSVYPTAEQVESLAGLLRARGLTAVSIGAGASYLEVLLQRSGVDVVPVDVDGLPSHESYDACGCYCSTLRRVPPDAFYHLARPASTALLFVWGRALPWRAYLSRYPSLEMVVIVGDPADGDGATEPGALALDGCPGWHRVLRVPVRARLPQATMTAYERLPLCESDRGAVEQLLRAPSERPRIAPSYTLSVSREMVAAGMVPPHMLGPHLHVA